MKITQSELLKILDGYCHFWDGASCHENCILYDRCYMDIDFDEEKIDVVQDAE